MSIGVYEIWINIDDPIGRYELSSVFEFYNKNDFKSVVDQVYNLINHETRKKMNIGDKVTVLYHSPSMNKVSSICFEEVVREPVETNKYVFWEHFGMTYNYVTGKAESK